MLFQSSLEIRSLDVITIGRLTNNDERQNVLAKGPKGEVKFYWQRIFVETKNFERYFFDF